MFCKSLNFEKLSVIMSNRRGGEKMGKAEDLIKSILADKKLSGEKIYRDEPLIFTASQMKNYTPPEYGKMRKLISGKDSVFAPSNEIFYKQGRFMENFEDNFDYHGDFIRYFPTYREMNNLQLRGYFSWRTKLRHGRLEKTCTSFAFVYIYELINRIGVSSSEDGFYKLKAFAEEYGKLDRTVEKYAVRWLKDYAVYYNLDPALLKDFKELQNDNALLTLMNYRTKTPDEILDALENFSSYKLKNSAFYKKYPKETADTVYRLFCILYERYEKHSKNGIFGKLFGKSYNEPYFMFNSAVFYEPEPHSDCVYEINGINRYICEKNKWRIERFYPMRDKAGKLGAILKNTDYRLRQKYGFKSQLKPVETAKIFETAIKKAVDEQYAENQRNKKPKIEIDLSKLKSIRETSIATRDKLIVEEPEEITEEPAESREIDNAMLDKACTEILKALLNGADAEKAARQNGIMLSTAIDSVNEALFDTFGDIVIDFGGDKPEIIEDYSEELREMFCK